MVDSLRRVLAIDPFNRQALDRLERHRYDQAALKPKKSLGGVLLWAALAAVVACAGDPLC